MWVKYEKINLNLDHVIEFHLDPKDIKVIVFETIKERVVFKFENDNIRNFVFNYLNWCLTGDAPKSFNVDQYIHELTKEED